MKKQILEQRQKAFRQRLEKQRSIPDSMKIHYNGMPMFKFYIPDWQATKYGKKAELMVICRVHSVKGAPVYRSINVNDCPFCNA